MTTPTTRPSTCWVDDDHDPFDPAEAREHWIDWQSDDVIPDHHIARWCHETTPWTISLFRRWLAVRGPFIS